MHTRIQEVKKIVIVEDEESLATIFENEITHCCPHFDTFIFTSSLEALNFIRSNEVDLVITDGKMPHMSGVDLGRNLRAKGISVPMILVTGHVDYLDRVKKEGLFFSIHEKPVEFDVFFKDIAKATGEKSDS